MFLRLGCTLVCLCDSIHRTRTLPKILEPLIQLSLEIIGQKRSPNMLLEFDPIRNLLFTMTNTCLFQLLPPCLCAITQTVRNKGNTTSFWNLLEIQNFFNL
ncbi:hypothetical protein LINGRAHAP2_LOCUS15323 [Linum grandiflorum]